MTHGLTFVDSALLDEIDHESAATSPSSALRTIGGARAVAAVVDEFYRRLLADEVTARYFVDLPLDTLKRHQVLLLVKVLGGPDRYAGRDLRTAHAHLAINDEVYARVCLYLLTVMHEFKVPMDVLVAAERILDSVRTDIVTTQHVDDGQG